MALSAEIGSWVRAAGLNPEHVQTLVRHALDEDLGGGADVTTEATVSPTQVNSGDVRARQAGVVAGISVAAAVFDMCLGDRGWLEPRGADGNRVGPGDAVLTVSGPTRQILTAERSALNLLCRLSGVATQTRSWVDAVNGTGAVIRDTRKTTPGLRELEKYAVRCGGGENHRQGLADAALIKDNHVRAAGGVTAALHGVRASHPDLTCEVECDTLEQVREALEGGARLLLLDNMETAELRQAAGMARGYGAATEASGGLSLAGAADVAATGVGYLAVGALTHSAPALDFGLDLH